jgi:hypothetical protein
MRQLGLFLTAPQSHLVEPLPDLIRHGLGFRFLTLHHHDTIVRVADISSWARGFLVLGITGCGSLLSRERVEWSDECVARRP